MFDKTAYPRLCWDLGVNQTVYIKDWIWAGESGEWPSIMGTPTYLRYELTFNFDDYGKKGSITRSGGTSQRPLLTHCCSLSNNLWKTESRKPPKEHSYPLETSHWNLLEIPIHNSLKKVIVAWKCLSRLPLPGLSLCSQSSGSHSYPRPSYPPRDTPSPRRPGVP